MNSNVTFPPPAPVLKLNRPSTEKWAATVAEERRRLQEDQEALRERETNLREYEARLRAWQAELDAGRGAPAPRTSTTASPFQRPSSRVPFADDAALQAAWEKLHRARELLEAEQNHLRDDRIVMRDQMETVKRREEAVTAREAALAEREALVTAALQPAKDQASGEPSVSAVTRLTRAPFDMARSVFGGKK